MTHDFLANPITQPGFFPIGKSLIIMNKNPLLNQNNLWTVKIGEGIGPLKLDPGVHYQGPLPSPILTVQALVPFWTPLTKLEYLWATCQELENVHTYHEHLKQSILHLWDELTNFMILEFKCQNIFNLKSFQNFLFIGWHVYAQAFVISVTHLLSVCKPFVKMANE